MMQNGRKVVNVIKNALGQEIPIYEDGPEDFIENAKTYSNAKLSYENIEIGKNPNIKKVFKFNRERNEGWVVNYDFEKKEEVKKGSVVGVEQLYPFNIDFNNGVVTTKLRENYPLMMTDEIPSEEIQNIYATLKRIETEKQQS